MYIYIYVCVCVYVYMIFTTKGFFEAAMESWPEWDLKSPQRNSVQTL